MLEKFHHNLDKFSTYERPRGNALEFTIQHYAGAVTYCAATFLEKNRDTLAVDLVAVMRLSTNELINELFGGEGPAGKKSKKANRKDLRKSVKRVRAERDKSSKATTSQGFTKSLKELMVEMNMANPHFIRQVLSRITLIICFRNPTRIPP